MIRIFAFLLFQTTALTLIGQSCKNLPTRFSTYEQAIYLVKNASFQFKDEVNTSKSSWIRSASYYSCDGITGFFILGTDKQEYIHADLPKGIWEAFKRASSFGKYYDYNIRYKFHLNL